MKKLILTIFAFFLISLFAMPFVAAAPTFDVEVKGISQADEPVSIIAGENVPIRIDIKVMEDIEEVYAKAEFEYENGKITALSSAFDLVDNSTYVLGGSNRLYLGIPQDIVIDEEEDDLFIHIQLEDEDGDVIDSDGIDLETDFKVILQRETNKISIQNVTLPNAFIAGEKTLVTAAIKNLGTNPQSNLYAQLAVSRLGILSKEDIGALTEAGDEDDTVVVDIPLILSPYTESGTYTLELKVFNDDLSVSHVRAIDVDGVRTGVKFTEVLPMDVILDVEQNERVAFRISILNLGTTTQTYDISLADDTRDWGTVQIEPDRVTLQEDEKKVVEVYVSPNRETLGEQVFTATVKSEDDVVEELKLVADVKESELTFSTINPFLLSIIVAAIILVVIIITMFGARLKGEFASRIRALTQVSQARDIGREEAKKEVTDLMHDMTHTIMRAQGKEKEDLTEKTADRVSKIIHPLRGEEVDEVMTGAIDKLSDKEEIETERNAHKIAVREHTQEIIDGIISNLKEKEEVDDVVHKVAHNIKAQELGPEGTEKAIITLEALRERLGQEVEKIEEEEEVIKKAGKAKKTVKKGKKGAKKSKKKKANQAVKKGKKVKKTKAKKAKKKGKAVKKVKGKTIAKKAKKTAKKKPAKKKLAKKAKKVTKKKSVKKKTAKKAKKAKKKAKKTAKKPDEKKKKEEKASLVEKVTTRTIEKY